MTTYFCKCGRTFQKNTEAATTGLRMPDYGPNHECYGCPFVCRVLTWDPVKEAQAVQNHECRGSKSIRYDTTIGVNITDKTVATVCTLDFDFLRQVHEFATVQEGFEPDRYFFDNRSASYGADGRFRYTLYPTQNQKGVAAKAALMERFFNSYGHRKDVAPEQEKEIVLNQIKEAKALAQGKTAPTEVGTVYYHHNLVYFADQRENSKQFTAFMDDADRPSPDTRTEVATIPDFDTFEEAQNALNGLARKRGFSTERSAPEKAPETEQPDDLGPDGMEELAEYRELTGGPDTNDPPESGNEKADLTDNANEMPGSENSTGDSENDSPETQQGPCDWRNASGDDEDGSEDGPDDETPEVAGDPLSLRGPEFDAIFTAADGVLNRLVAMLHEKKQRDGEMTIKVTFEDADGMGAFIFGGAVSGKINYTVKPQKIVGDALELQFDAQGNPVVPSDREHQLNFDELQPGREIPPSGTATVDGKTGIIEDYQEDGPAQDHKKVENEEQPYLCKNIDCPYYASISDKQECTFDPDDSNCTEDPDFKQDITDAVQFQRCTRPEVMEAYAAAHPNEEESFENNGNPDDGDDFPPFDNNELEDNAS